MHLDIDPANEPDEDAIFTACTHEDTVAELLELCDEFFRCQASPRVHEQ